MTQPRIMTSILLLSYLTLVVFWGLFCANPVLNHPVFNPSRPLEKSAHASHKLSTSKEDNSLVGHGNGVPLPHGRLNIESAAPTTQPNSVSNAIKESSMQNRDKIEEEDIIHAQTPTKEKLAEVIVENHHERSQWLPDCMFFLSIPAKL